MRVFPQEVYLHGLGRFPDYVYSVDMALGGGRVFVVTGGADSVARVWTVGEKFQLAVHSELTGHSLGVNCVRFAPDGSLRIATGSDDGKIVIWKQTAHFEDSTQVRWVPYKVCNCLDEVVHVAWSPCGQMVVGACQREMSHVFNIHTGRTLQRLDGHLNRVLGVCWDPLGELIVSQSTDRTVRVYEKRPTKLVFTNKALIKEQAQEKWKMFISDSHFPDDPSAHFFRRPAFSPDGSMVVLPGGLSPAGKYLVYLYGRKNLFTNAPPTAIFTTACSPAISVRFHPSKFCATDDMSKTFFVFAITTVSSFYVLRSDRKAKPIAFGTDLHCTAIVDAAWSPDAETLALVSTDGYMTLVRFERGELGGVPQAEVHAEMHASLETPEEIEEENVERSSHGVEGTDAENSPNNSSHTFQLPEYPEVAQTTIQKRRITPILL